MDNNILEMFAKMMGNSQNNGNNYNSNYQNNPAYENYPKEAYIQTDNNQNKTNANFSNSFNGQQNNNFQNENLNNNLNNNFFNNSSNNFLNGFANMFGNFGQNNQFMPLLMSLMGKNSSLSTLSEIFNLQKKSPCNDEETSIKDDSQNREINPSDEILL